MLKKPPPSPIPIPATTVDDRLRAMLFLVGAFHLIVILGITFAPPASDSGAVPTLDVMLVNDTSPSNERNDDPSYLAERTQLGAGNASDGRTESPATGNAPVDRDGSATGTAADAQRAGDATARERLLATRGTSTRYTFVAPPTPAPGATAALLVAGGTAPAVADDDGTDLRVKGEADRELFVGPSTRQSSVAVYLDAWRRRIEQVGTVNFPDQARRSGMSGSPVVEVAIDASGELAEVVVRRSSGYGELDQAAVAIVKLAAPFDRFPRELATEHDRIRFAYEWQFIGGRLAGSTVSAPADTR